MRVFIWAAFVANAKETYTVDACNALAPMARSHNADSQRLLAFLRGLFKGWHVVLSNLCSDGSPSSQRSPAQVWQMLYMYYTHDRGAERCARML